MGLRDIQPAGEQVLPVVYRYGRGRLGRHPGAYVAAW